MTCVFDKYASMINTLRIHLLSHVMHKCGVSVELLLRPNYIIASTAEVTTVETGKH